MINNKHRESLLFILRIQIYTIYLCPMFISYNQRMVLLMWVLQ